MLHTLSSSTDLEQQINDFYFPKYGESYDDEDEQGEDENMVTPQSKNTDTDLHCSFCMNSGALWVPHGGSRAPVFLPKPFKYCIGARIRFYDQNLFPCRFRHPTGSMLAPVLNQNRENRSPEALKPP